MASERSCQVLRYNKDHLTLTTNSSSSGAVSPQLPVSQTLSLMSSPHYFGLDLYVYLPVSAATFVLWEYCLTLDEEIEYIWRRELSRVTALFTAIRYIPIISSNLFLANHISLFIPTSNSTCTTWLVVIVTWTAAMVICFEILLVMRVLALYAHNRLMRKALITMLLCASITRIIIFAILLPQFEYGDLISSNNVLQKCHITKLPSIDLSAAFIIEIIPEAVLISLAFINLIQTKRRYNIAVSNLLVVIVRDGTWAFACVFALILCNILQLKLRTETGDDGIIWVTPILGFIGSRLILNLRSEARTQPGGTNVETFEISFPRFDASESIHDPV